MFNSLFAVRGQHSPSVPFHKPRNILIVYRQKGVNRPALLILRGEEYLELGDRGSDFLYLRSALRDLEVNPFIGNLDPLEQKKPYCCDKKYTKSIIRKG